MLFTENFCPVPTANHIMPVTTCFVSAVSGQEVSGGVVIRSCLSATLNVMVCIATFAGEAV